MKQIGADSRKRQNYEAEVASSVKHSRYLRKNTNDRNAEESAPSLISASWIWSALLLSPVSSQVTPSPLLLRR